MTEQESSWKFPQDLPEAAWILLANAWNGNWEAADPEWRQAAIRWRDAYYETLSRPEEPGEERPRCDVRLVTRPVGTERRAFMVRRLFINDREYLIPSSSEVLIHASTRPEVCTLQVTLFPTSVRFEDEQA